MPTDAFVAVLIAAILHACWNAVAKGKSGSDPLMTSLAIAFGAAIIALPCMALTSLPAAESLPYVVASAAIHVGYFLAVGLAYERSDYSVVYPVNRGSAPLLTALTGAMVVGEQLRPGAWIGIGLLSLGIVSLGYEAMRRRGFDSHSLILAGLTACIIVAYTIVDGLGARASANPAAYVLSMMVLTGLALLPVAVGLRGRRWTSQIAARWQVGIFGGAIATLSYGIALWAMTRAPIGLVGALRETSVLFATLIAAVLLKERFGIARWVSASLILAGLALIQLA